VLQAAVVAYKDEHDLIKPKAYIVPKAGYKSSKELGKDIQDFVKHSIAPYKFPRQIEFLKEMPMTATGKIQRHRLR
jgi:acyl-coenzyme A synthetase/AMP-(fatty) acid ligase